VLNEIKTDFTAARWEEKAPLCIPSIEQKALDGWGARRQPRTAPNLVDPEKVAFLRL
jgi:hypothetical protein